MAFMYGIIGANGAGKSVTMRQMVKHWRKSTPYGKVYKHDVQGDFLDIKGTEIVADKKADWINDVVKNKNCLLLLDELRVLNPANTINENFIKLFAVWRKKNINIIYTVHNPSMILERFSFYTTKYFLFFNYAREEHYKAKITDYEVLHSASKLINNYRKAVGNDNDYEKLYPKFPYMIVDTKRSEIKVINFNSNTYKLIQK